MVERMARLGCDRYGDPGSRTARWSAFDRGGHLAAREAPGLLVGDVRAFLGRL